MVYSLTISKHAKSCSAGNIEWGPFVKIVPDHAKYHMNCESIYKLRYKI